MAQKKTLLYMTRTAAKLRKADLARRASVSRSHYGRIETGSARASLRVARNIASALNGRIGELQIMELGPALKAPKPRKKSEAA